MPPDPPSPHLPEPAAAPRPLLLGGARPTAALRAVLVHFRGDDISLRAGALTYVSVFSLVPLVTLSLLAVGKLDNPDLHERLRVFIEGVLAPGVAPSIREGSADLLERFIKVASSRAASFVSFATLVVTAATLLKNLDGSINELWRVPKKRAWWVRGLQYAVALTLGPALLGLSLVGSRGLSHVLVLAHVPLPLLWVGARTAPVVALTSLYLYAPNAPVRFRPALLGGLCAGAGWEAAKYGYAAFAAQTFRYNLLYGSLGAAPLFLLWLYVSWLLVLFGARLAYAIQHASYRDTWPLFELHPRSQELLATRVAQWLALTWAQGVPPKSAGELAHALNIPEDSLLPILDALERAQLVTRTEHYGIHAARDPSQLTVADACAAVRERRTDGELHELLLKSPDLAALDGLLASAEGQARVRLAEVSWAMLAKSRANSTPDSAPAPTSGAAGS